MPETLEISMEGAWGDTNSGGKRKLENKVNAAWCLNP